MTFSMTRKTSLIPSIVEHIFQNNLNLCSQASVIHAWFKSKLSYSLWMRIVSILTDVRKMAIHSKYKNSILSNAWKAHAT